MENQSLPPNFRARQLSAGFANSNVLYALAKTGVIEELRDGAKSLEQLAGKCNLDSGVLFRILRYAAGLGIISSENGQYALTDSGKFLLKDVPGSVHGGLMLSSRESERMSWRNLIHSLKTGESAFTHTMGSPFFEYIETDTEYAALFSEWMTANSMMEAEGIPPAYDFSPFRTIVDIAGGQGFLLKSILMANPHLHGILYDLNSVVNGHILNGLSDRITVKSGDFFESVPKADVLMMKHIIHDWNDEKASQILRTCRRVLDTGTKLLIIERVLDDEADMGSLFLDLHMQVMVGGKERSAEEFEELLRGSGLKLNRIIPTGVPVKIIEATT